VETAGFTGRVCKTRNLEDFPLKPSLNDFGTVAFTGLLDAGGSGIYTSNDGVTTTIATAVDHTAIAILQSTGCALCQQQRQSAVCGLPRHT